jgi:hypothetical protein
MQTSFEGGVTESYTYDLLYKPALKEVLLKATLMTSYANQL